MPDINRRRFLQLAGASAAFAAMANSIEQAAAIPAHRRLGTIQDVEHIVVLMQENRSFDPYFGTLNGVRGFGDPRPVTLDVRPTCSSSQTYDGVRTDPSCRPHASILTPFGSRVTHLGPDRYMERDLRR